MFKDSFEGEIVLRIARLAKVLDDFVRPGVERHPAKKYRRFG